MLTPPSPPPSITRSGNRKQNERGLGICTSVAERIFCCDYGPVNHLVSWTVSLPTLHRFVGNAQRIRAQRQLSGYPAKAWSLVEHADTLGQSLGYPDAKQVFSTAICAHARNKTLPGTVAHTWNASILRTQLQHPLFLVRDKHNMWQLSLRIYLPLKLRTSSVLAGGRRFCQNMAPANLTHDCRKRSKLPSMLRTDHSHLLSPDADKKRVHHINRKIWRQKITWET